MRPQTFTWSKTHISGPACSAFSGKLWLSGWLPELSSVSEFSSADTVGLHSSHFCIFAGHPGTELFTWYIISQTPLDTCKTQLFTHYQTYLHKSTSRRFSLFMVIMGFPSPTITSNCFWIVNDGCFCIYETFKTITSPSLVKLYEPINECDGRI